MKFEDLIAYRILAWCKENDQTVNRLATLSELSQTAVESIATGKTENPNFCTLCSLALGMNMTVSEFLDFPEVNELTLQELRKFKKLKRDARKGKRVERTTG